MKVQSIKRLKLFSSKRGRKMEVKYIIDYVCKEKAKKYPFAETNLKLLLISTLIYINKNEWCMFVIYMPAIAPGAKKKEFSLKVCFLCVSKYSSIGMPPSKALAINKINNNSRLSIYISFFYLTSLIL